MTRPAIDLAAIRERVEAASKDGFDAFCAEKELAHVAVPMLLSLVDDLAAVLCEAEWTFDVYRHREICPCCSHERDMLPPSTHRPDCRLDASLRALGLDTQEQRDGVRGKEKSP